MFKVEIVIHCQLKSRRTFEAMARAVDFGTSSASSTTHSDNAKSTAATSTVEPKVGAHDARCAGHHAVVSCGDFVFNGDGNAFNNLTINTGDRRRSAKRLSLKLKKGFTCGWLLLNAFSIKKCLFIGSY